MIGFFLILVFIVVVSSMVGESDEEEAGEFCKACGAELLDCDDCCIICGQPSQFLEPIYRFSCRACGEGRACIFYEEDGLCFFANADDRQERISVVTEESV